VDRLRADDQICAGEASQQPSSLFLSVRAEVFPQAAGQAFKIKQLAFPQDQRLPPGFTQLLHDLQVSSDVGFKFLPPECGIGLG
jgi:hypothetical protein